MPKPLTMWITTNCGKFLKRWEHQTTLPVSWEIRMQFKKQQLKRLFLIHCIFLPPLSKIRCPYVRGFISGLSILFHWSIFLSNKEYFKWSLKSVGVYPKTTSPPCKKMILVSWLPRRDILVIGWFYSLSAPPWGHSCYSPPLPRVSSGA